MLAVYGFSTYESSGVIFVVPDPNMRQLSAPVVDPKHLDTPDAQWITVVYPLATLNAAQLVPVLRPLTPQAAQLSQVQGRNVLVIVDRTANVRRLIAVIRDMEKAPALGMSTESPSPSQ